MITLADRLSRISRPRALTGMLITCIAALSVHVVMLQVLNIPYPAGYPTTGWPVVCVLSLSAFALIIFYDRCSESFSRVSLPLRCLFLFLLASMLSESLIRLPVMNGFATTAWRYSIVESLPRLIRTLLICCLVVLATYRLRQLWQKLAGAVAIAAIVQLLCVPVVSKVFGHILASIAYLDHDEVYKAPYGWQIEVPAYITYMEPVMTCFVMVALVWDRLAKNLSVRTIQFALLVMAITGRLLAPFIYVLYSTFRPALALLSMGQFFLEALTLGGLTTLTWRWCQKGTGTGVTNVKAENSVGAASSS